MTTLQEPRPSTRPRWVRHSILLAAALGTLLLLIAWGVLLSGHPVQRIALLAGLAAFLLGSAYALNLRPQAGRLLGFGNKYVQVRSLDEWTEYQYGVSFDAASPEQQSEALNHYRVGLRLFPSRPQDAPPRQRSWQWLLTVLTYCATITLFEAAHGRYRFATLFVFYAWLWGCMRISRRFTDTPALTNLTELHLH